MSDISETLEKFMLKDNKTGVIIRLGRQEDIEQIISIESICFPAAEAASAESFHRRFGAFPENFIVAQHEENKKVIGFINGCCTDSPELPDELYSNEKLHVKNGKYQTVFGIDTLPEFQRNGIGTKLMQNLIKLSKIRGKKGVVLTCKDHLIRFYEKFGFELRGRSRSTHGGAVWNDMVLVF